MNKYLVEFIGTFFLLLAIYCCVVGGAGKFAPIGIGTALMVMIYAGGHISGAHYNPAVTLAVWLRGKVNAMDVPWYILAQLLGGVLAVIAGKALVGNPAAVAKTANFVPALLAEFLGTFALCYVILNVATSKGTEGNSFYGLAIGLTVTAMAYAVGGVSGGAFNPAVAVAGIFGNILPMGGMAYFLIGQFAAAALAAFVFKATSTVDA